MNLKKSLLVAVPALAMAVGALAFSFSASKKGAIEADAADYSISNRGLSITDGAVNATFTVSNSDLDMEGWLLCLFENQPSFNPSTRKLTGSNDLHPYSAAGCSHYFFVSSEKDDGAVTVTWAANSNDQKTHWSSTGGTGAENETLSYYLGLSTDWYFVIGPRHIADYGGSHSEEDVGAGYDNYWENCDYYVGRKSNLIGDLPSGEIYLDLSQAASEWQKSDEKFSIYFWDEADKNNENKKVFTSFANQTSISDTIKVISYELDFVPTNMIAICFDKSVATPSWDSKDAQTGDLTFYEHGVIGSIINNDWSCALATIKGLGREVILDHYQRSGGESEHYNTSVFLQAGDEFTISFGGTDTFNSFTNHYYLDGVFTTVDNKIHVGQTGEYSLYFKTTENSENLYITTRKYAAAENWAISFITNGENDKCDHTKGLWAYWKDNSSLNPYNDLADDVQDLFKYANHIEHNVTITDRYIEQAIQRYDYILEIYGTNPYYDFMGRVDAKKVTPKTSNVRTLVENNNTAMIVTIVSMISVAGLGAFLFYKKKRVQD